MRIFPKIRALSVLSVYRPLTSCKISEKPNAYIHITTSQFKIKLNTDLKYCGTNMEIIRICTKDYDIKKILLKIDEKFTK